MYATYACNASTKGYALWAQLEDPSPTDNALVGVGPTNYDGTRGMNYKVINP